MYRKGEGTETDPFVSEDGTAGIGNAIASCTRRGGLVKLQTGRYDLTRTIEINVPCVCLEGDVWAYNSDPNGVFETSFGTKLRLHGTTYPAIRIGTDRTTEGCIVRNLGIQGDIRGMDTRQLLDWKNPLASSGLTLSRVRVDQAEFSKLSFCGLQCGVCAVEDAEVDACLFEKLNVDGCAIGAYFAPRAAYYVRMHEWVAADNPYYGLYACGDGRQNKRMEISKIQFIRSGGAFVKGDGLIHAAVCLDGIHTSVFRENLIDDAGMFWLFPPDAVKNSTHETILADTVSLYIRGNDNIVAENVISNSHSDAVWVRGNRNILLNNVVDRDVILEGSGNTVSGLFFTDPKAKLILCGAANQVMGVPEDRIIRATTIPT